METLRQRIDKAAREVIAIAPYDPSWPGLFEEEKSRLLGCLPGKMIGRVEHFGSTAVPGLAAKPIVDMLVEVVSLDEAKRVIVPILESRGYDYFWRPAFDNATPPFYAWFIRRNGEGVRTHHIHMVEKDSVLWERLFFRNCLIKFPGIAKEYAALKMGLALNFPADRVAYTKGKTAFIERIMAPIR